MGHKKTVLCGNKMNVKFKTENTRCSVTLNIEAENEINIYYEIKYTKKCVAALY